MRADRTREGSLQVTRPKLTAALERLLVAFRPGVTGSLPANLTSVPQRLLVAKVHGMGDSVLIRMVVQQLSERRERHPEMLIGVLAGPATREVMTIDTNWMVHLYSQKELDLAYAYGLMKRIRRMRYDAVLNFEQGSIAGTAFLRATGIPIHLGFIPVAKSPKVTFLTHGVPFEDTRSMWSSFVTLARIIDPELSETPRTLELKGSPETRQWLGEWWRAKIGDEDETAVALHLGCGPGMDFKRWPLERFVRLAETIALESRKITFILTGTAIEKPLIREFIKAYGGYAVDASDAGSIDHTAAILKRSSLLISNDTGVMHLGAALGVPTLGLFGPTTPRHWGPIGRQATAMYDTSVQCSPCVNNYQNLMPTSCVNADYGRCMRDIGLESVTKAARTLLSVPAVQL